MEDIYLIQEINKLKYFDISYRERVHCTIEILEILDRKFEGFLMDDYIFFDETERESILNLYRKSLNTLNVYEGVDISLAATALNSCLMLIQLILGLEWECYPCGRELLEPVRELI